MLRFVCFTVDRLNRKERERDRENRIFMSKVSLRIGTSTETFALHVQLRSYPRKRQKALQ